MEKLLTNYQNKHTKHKKTRKNYVFSCFFLISLLVFFVLVANIFSTFLTISKVSLFNFDYIYVPNAKIYCISYGEFSTNQLAEKGSALIISKGGAGVVYKDDDKFKIIVSCYESDSSRNKVIDNNSDNETALSTLDIDIKKIKIDTNKLSSSEDKKIVNDVAGLYLSTYKKLKEYSNQLDSGDITTTNCFNLLYNVSSNIEELIEKYKNVSLSLTSKDYIYLLNVSKNIESKINKLILTTKKEDLSSEIKRYFTEIVLITMQED